MQGSPTTRTGKFPHPEGTLFPVAAHWTVLACMLGVYPHDPPTSFFRFVGEDLEKLRPTRIQNSFG